MSDIVLQDTDGDNITLSPSTTATVVLEDTDTPDIQISAEADGRDGQGVPTGGTTGQVLKKNSTTDYDTSWADVGTGDMTKAVYDTDNDGVVDNSEALNGQLPSYYLNRTNHTGTQAESTITNLVSDLAAKQGTITLTTTGTSGAATLISNTLNIPQYSGGGGSGITRSVNTISSPTTAGSTANTDYVYLVSGTTTLTLPTAVGNTNRYSVTNVGTNTVTVATTSAQTINGSSAATLPRANMSLDFISNGSNWVIE